MRIVLVGGIVAACVLAACWLLARADGVTAAPPAANYQVTGPEMQRGLATYVITSDYQEKPCPVWVLLPDKFDKAAQYKVLYILPALEAGDNEGMREAKKLGLADKYNIICVGPGYSRMPWYGDNPNNPKIRYDSYLPDVIVPFIDKTYPTIAKPEGRVLVGFSKSGLGAVSELLRHPEVFGRAGAWDAPLLEDGLRADYYGTKENFMKEYYIPNLLARRAEMLKNQPARIAITGVGWGGIEAGHKKMEELKIPHHFNPNPKVNHEWKSGWLGPLVEVLMSDDMTKVATTPAK
jgi:enterochelin esterase-like enzyme